jgi:K+-transporting ATPase c subunit
MLQHNAKAPFGGLAGEPLINVLVLNLQLINHFGAPPA